jgi:hypothetical protein
LGTRSAGLFPHFKNSTFMFGIALGLPVKQQTMPNWHALTSKHQNDYVLMMRTTLTIDDDVAATLERLRRSQRLSLKQLVNEALRRGLDDMGKRRKRREQVQTRAVALGRVQVASIDNITEALAIVEGENFK